jgi:chromosome segregation ATPase
MRSILDERVAKEMEKLHDTSPESRPPLADLVSCLALAELENARDREALHQKLDALQTTAASILVEAKRTNGRVTELENQAEAAEEVSHTMRDWKIAAVVGWGVAAAVASAIYWAETHGLFDFKP